MSGVAIKVEGLSKRYRLGQYIGGAYQYRALRDVLTDAIYTPFRRLRTRNKKRVAGSNPVAMSHQLSANFIWALKDVSFEVKQGEVVGIIGRNGAGKSTLLKVLSRITEPTEGRAEIKGRIRSLLEVGTGFHPELTGRENIYLSGAILGMTKKEIDRKFDEIVAFAELEKFIDTPVKRYSSGMLVRLGFAVAAHLEPEILLVDEVLAVGDAAFQKKCLGKVGDVASEGRTVLFVSHNMAAVENLCQRAIVLDEGRIICTGQKTEAISHYLNSLSNYSGSTSLRLRSDRRGSGELRVMNIKVRDTEGNPLNTVRGGQDVDILFHYETTPDFQTTNVIVSLVIRTQLGMSLISFHNRLTGDVLKISPPKGTFVCRLYRLPLAASTYNIHFSIRRVGDNRYFDYMDNAMQLTVVAGDYYGTGEMHPGRSGSCLVDGSWRLESG